MTENEVSVLLKSYLGDIEIPEELVDQILGYYEESWDQGYIDGFDKGYDTGYDDAGKMSHD